MASIITSASNPFGESDSSLTAKFFNFFGSDSIGDETGRVRILRTSESYSLLGHEYTPYIDGFPMARFSAEASFTETKATAGEFGGFCESGAITRFSHLASTHFAYYDPDTGKTQQTPTSWIRMQFQCDSDTSKPLTVYVHTGLKVDGLFRSSKFAPGKASTPEQAAEIAHRVNPELIFNLEQPSLRIQAVVFNCLGTAVITTSKQRESERTSLNLFFAAPGSKEPTLMTMDKRSDYRVDDGTPTFRLCSSFGNLVVSLEKDKERIIAEINGLGAGILLPKSL